MQQVFLEAVIILIADLIEPDQISCSAFSAFLCRMQSLVNYSRKSILKQSGHQKEKAWAGKDRPLVSAAVQDKQPSFFLSLQKF